jgi:hypothetical protein
MELDEHEEDEKEAMESDASSSSSDSEDGDFEYEVEAAGEDEQDAGEDEQEQAGDHANSNNSSSSSSTTSRFQYRPSDAIAQALGEAAAAEAAAGEAQPITSASLILLDSQLAESDQPVALFRRMMKKLQYRPDMPLGVRLWSDNQLVPTRESLQKLFAGAHISGHSHLPWQATLTACKAVFADGRSYGPSESDLRKLFHGCGCSVTYGPWTLSSHTDMQLALTELEGLVRSPLQVQATKQHRKIRLLDEAKQHGLSVCLSICLSPCLSVCMADLTDWLSVWLSVVCCGRRAAAMCVSPWWQAQTSRQEAGPLTASFAQSGLPGWRSTVRVV